MQSNNQETPVTIKRTSFCFAANANLMARVDQHSKRVYEQTGIKTSRSRMIAALIERGLAAVSAT